jgi:hypothetical protein
VLGVALAEHVEVDPVEHLDAIGSRHQWSVS